MVFSQELSFSDVGEAVYDYLGFDVAISGNGMFLAAGAPDGDPNGLTRAGYARLYAKSGTDWNMFQQINGTVSSSYLGRSLDLSHDGSMLTVGSLSGSVYIYELSSNSFLYELLHTINIDAWEVGVSGDGMVVGVTSGSSIGAKIFERIGGVFQQRGTDISGYTSGIALNYAGTIVIVGDSNWSSNTGRTGVFQWKDDDGDGSMQWMQMGSDITGDTAYDYFGYFGSESITYDGLTVAVGAFGFDWDGLSDRGLVRVYNYDTTDNTWNQSGNDIVGDASGDYFSRTVLSSDGNYLGVGAYVGTYVKTFEKNGSNYEIVGDTIIGETGGFSFGWSFDMTADGSTAAISDDSVDNSKGKVYLYDNFLTSPITPTISATIAPTVTFSLPPSIHKSSVPTIFPSFIPSSATFLPSKFSSSSPSKSTSVNPTHDITNPPTNNTSNHPSLKLTTHPSAFPSDKPVASPSSTPVTPKPTTSPTISQTTTAPTRLSFSPTPVPVNLEVSFQPSEKKSFIPSKYPSITPNAGPSMEPTLHITRAPSVIPSIRPTISFSLNPSTSPVVVVSLLPSAIPSTFPLTSPSVMPSLRPSNVPFESSSVKPSIGSSAISSSLPSISNLSFSPTPVPTHVEVSASPSKGFSFIPSTYPLLTPNADPSMQPTLLASIISSSRPTVSFSVAPTVHSTAVSSSFQSITPSSTRVPFFTPSAPPMKDTSNTQSSSTIVESSRTAFILMMLLCMI